MVWYCWTTASRLCDKWKTIGAGGHCARRLLVRLSDDVLNKEMLCEEVGNMGEASTDIDAGKAGRASIEVSRENSIIP